MIKANELCVHVTHTSKARFARQEADLYRKDCGNGAGNLAFFLRCANAAAYRPFQLLSLTPNLNRNLNLFSAAVRQRAASVKRLGLGN